MKILITNDDGYNSEGIISLYQEFGKDDNGFVDRLLVVAPDRERSVSGHSITYQVPVRIKEIYRDGKMEIYSCTGSPADCVIIGKGYFEKDIDLVISGINRGANLGLDLTVSGTFSAVIEALVYGVNGIAVSLFQYDDPDYTFASIFVYEFVYLYSKIMKNYKDIILNINIPPWNVLKEDSFPLITYQSKFRHLAELESRIDPRNNLYFWIYWKKLRKSDELFKDFDEKLKLGRVSDFEAVNKNYISITPILMDFNLYHSLDIDIDLFISELRDMAAYSYQKSFQYMKQKTKL